MNERKTGTDLRKRELKTKETHREKEREKGKERAIEV